MAVTVLNTDAGLTSKTLLVAESAQTLTAAKTFDLDPAAPFIVTSGSAVVTNLDADKVDGVEAASFLRSDAADTKDTGDLTFNDSIAAVFGTGGDATIKYDGTDLLVNSKVVGSGVFGLTGILSVLTGQVKFPATANPSSDVNTLDDYEEGTWTPVLTFATPGDLSVAYGAGGQNGLYTKIGNRVFIDVMITTTTFTHTTASGAVKITGLPFTPAATFFSAGTLRFDNITAAGYTQFVLRANPAQTYLDILASGSGVTAAGVTTANMTSGAQVSLHGSVSFTI